MGLGDFLGNVFGSHTDEGDVKPVVSAQNIQAQNVGLDQGALGQQQGFANQLQQQMNGNGPSLAGNMLQNQAQQNAAGAMGMAASQRGVNSGLAMRQALMAGNQANQQAAQQASTARVQEQLGAQGMYGNQVNTLQNQNVGVQSANQKANLQAGMANQQAQGAANSINAGVAMDNTKTNNQVTGGVLSGISGAVGSFLAHGGVVGKPQYLAGGGFAQMGTSAGQSNPYADAFNFGGGSKKSTGGMSDPLSGGGGEEMAGGPMDAIGGGGGAAGALDSLGPLAMLASKGGKIPGNAKVPGDSYENDVVPTMLSPDEVVIPRSVSTHPGFLAALEKHVKSMPGDGPQGFAKVLAARKGSA